jgi:hypothetical protein
MSVSIKYIHIEAKVNHPHFKTKVMHNIFLLGIFLTNKTAHIKSAIKQNS